MIDLEYEPGSLVLRVPARRLLAFEWWLTDHWEGERDVRLPTAYAEHVLAHHGGVPGKACFTPPGGGVRRVGRFLNFLEAGDLAPPLTKSWRSWSPYPDVRLDYSVRAYFDLEQWATRLGAEGAYLLPVAGLDLGGRDCRGMEEYDLLCLDYRASGEPPVVAWSFDESWWGSGVVTSPVADSFEDFLGLLYRGRGRPGDEAIDSF